MRSTFQKVIAEKGVKGLAQGAGARVLLMGGYYIALGYASERIKLILPGLFWKAVPNS